MKQALVLTSAIGLAALPHFAKAQEVPAEALPGTIVSTAPNGQVVVENDANGTIECYVYNVAGYIGSQSVYRRGLHGATITFASVAYVDDTGGPNPTINSGLYLGGAVVKLSSPGTGTITFDDVWDSPPGSANPPTFPVTSFTQSYSSGVLKISFDINFPGGCNLPIMGIYHNRE